ncbi:MAG TPA: ATP-binding protein [Methylomirabilota bacterium]|nr:ATP-binding protein [Methylomirabilota bacterium]
MSTREITPTMGDPEFCHLLEALPAGAYTCDPDGLITYFNAHALELWGRAPRLNDPADRFCGSFKLFATDGTAIPHDDCWMARALRTEREFNGHEIVIERPDGERRTVLAHANPIRDAAGNVLGAVNVLVDITDRRHADDAARTADRSKTEFLAILAHELRNPLAPIRNAVQILNREGALAAESQWALSAIERQVRQMARLIDDLVDVARITSNRLELRKEHIDLAAVLRAAIETSGTLLKAGGQEFTVVLRDAPINLDADPVRLAQAVSNILNNAAKYTERGGHISLIAERDGEDAVVTVRDTGVGIPAAVLPHVFEMFTQGEQTRARTLGGLGIGLTLVKRLVELHGGAVNADSAGQNMGSTFVIRLPAVVDGTPGVLGEPNGSGGASSLPPLRMLIVDDNRDAADSLAMLLRTAGNDIRTAYDGIEALQVASEFRPEVVLLDIGLPKLDGHEVAQRLRHEAWGRRVCLIAVTGWSDEADRARSRAAGFDHHLVKPLDTAHLAQLLGSVDRSARS